jgi:hypothetical protein
MPADYVPPPPELTSLSKVFSGETFLFESMAPGFYTMYSWFFISCAVAYIPMVFGLRHYMKDKKEFTNLRPIIIVYNWFLTLFNVGCVYYIGRVVIKYYMANGMEATFCTIRTRDLDSDGGRWMLLFTAMKPVEMLDTVFLLLRKRPVILLHWWHHITVFLFCWHIIYAVNTDEGGEGMLFALMNACIHVLMYGYYALSSMRVRFPNAIASVLTILQIVQMVCGTWIEIKKAFFCGFSPIYPSPYLGLGMYLSYFILFTEYFVSRYILKSNKTKGE